MDDLRPPSGQIAFKLPTQSLTETDEYVMTCSRSKPHGVAYRMMYD
jgi:hypothetical protein